MSWDRYELGQKNIFYDEKLHLFYAKFLPSHVERVRQFTLDFSCALGGATDPSRLSNHSLQALTNDLNSEPALKAAQKAQREAVNIINGGYNEHKWAKFFEIHFFTVLSDSLSVSKEDSRRISRNKYFYDGIKRETDEMWTLFDGANGLGSFESMKRPKPDHAFFLPIYHSANKAGIPTISDPEARQWNQVQGPLGSEPFSWSTLKKLNEFGLQPTPRRIFNQQPLEADLKCYPWFVVEHKKEDESVRNVSCQAANAAACAVSLVQHSAQYAVKLLEEAHVPPIPAMTTVGSQVTIWLMHYAKDFDAPCSRRSTNEVTTKRRKEGHIMHAVWNGDMTKLTDTFRLQMILDNLHTWAMREFKPLISTYIDQWKYVHCHPSLDFKNSHDMLVRSKNNRDKTIEERRAILPIVQDLLEDHTTMELDGLSHQKVTPLLLGLFMHRICSSEREFIAKEVDRVVEDKLKVLNVNRPHKTRESSFSPSQNAASSLATGLLNNERPASTPRSSPATPIPSVDDDDPNDPDWRDSQHPSSANNQVSDASAEASDAEVSVAQSSDYEFSKQSSVVWCASEDVETPRATPCQSSIPERPKTHGRRGSPYSPGATSGSAENTSRPDSLLGHLTSNNVPKSPASPLRSQRQRSLKPRTPSGSPVFAGRSPPRQATWYPGRLFGQPKPSNSPIPRQSWHASEQESLIQPESGENNSYIDLTKDSQDESDTPQLARY